MRVTITIFSIIAGFLLFGNVYAQDINPVIGKTNDYVLREADFDRLISIQPVEIQQTLQNNPEQRINFLKQLLLTKAVAARAREEGFDRKPDVKEVISNLIDQYIAQEYINKKVVIPNITISDDEIKKYYSEHEIDFQIPEAVKVRHIFISSPKDASADLKEQARSKAEGILEQIRKGEDFDRIAKEQSEDTDSSDKGGELGYITSGKTNSQEFEKAVLALKEGEVGNLVETPFGYHIVKVDDRKEKRTATLDEAKDHINALLKEQNKQNKVQEFLENLARESGLEVMTTGKAGGLTNSQ